MSHIEPCLVCEASEHDIARQFLAKHKEWPCKNAEGDLVIDLDTLCEYINNDVWEEHEVETLNDLQALVDELEEKKATFAYLLGS